MTRRQDGTPARKRPAFDAVVLLDPGAVPPVPGRLTRSRSGPPPSHALFGLWLHASWTTSESISRVSRV